MTQARLEIKATAENEPESESSGQTASSTTVTLGGVRRSLHTPPTPPRKTTGRAPYRNIRDQIASQTPPVPCVRPTNHIDAINAIITCNQYDFSFKKILLQSLFALENADLNARPTHADFRDSYEDYGHTPLGTAALLGDCQLVRLVLELSKNKLDVNKAFAPPPLKGGAWSERILPHNPPPLGLAIQWGFIDIVTLLLQQPKIEISAEVEAQLKTHRQHFPENNVNDEMKLLVKTQLAENAVYSLLMKLSIFSSGQKLDNLYRIVAGYAVEPEKANTKEKESTLQAATKFFGL